MTKFGKKFKNEMKTIWQETCTGELNLLWFLWGWYLVGLFTVGPLGQ